MTPATAALLEQPPVAPPRGLPSLPTLPEIGGGSSGSGQPLAASNAAATVSPSGASGTSLVDLLPASLFTAPADPGSTGATIDTLPVQPALAGTLHQRPGPAAPVSALLGRSSMPSVPGSSGDSSTASANISNQLTAREWDELVDQIVERIEVRVIDELSRRGRRHDPFAL